MDHPVSPSDFLKVGSFYFNLRQIAYLRLYDNGSADVWFVNSHEAIMLKASEAEILRQWLSDKHPGQGQTSE